MEATVKVHNIVVDDIEAIVEELENEKSFQLNIYDGTDVESMVGVFFEHTNRDKACTIMFELKKEDAIFLGKSLTALAENI